MIVKGQKKNKVLFQIRRELHLSTELVELEEGSQLAKKEVKLKQERLVNLPQQPESRIQEHKGKKMKGLEMQELKKTRRWQKQSTV